MACGFAAAIPSGAAMADDRNWQLTWDDEFNGTSIDLTKWTFQTGGGGWGNGELEYYTNPTVKTQNPNAFVSDGVLHIRAIKEDYLGSTWTSARLNSLGSAGLSQTYGRFEVRAAAPWGQGLWPAYWMMPTDSVYGGWSNSGEIDILETHGQHLYNDWGTLHFGNPHVQTNHAPYLFTSPQHDASDWHTYALEWDPTEIRWYIDDYCYEIQNATSGPGGGPAWWLNADPSTFPKPYDQNYYILLNLAVGGNWPGYPDSTTPTTADFLIDYVRVYQDPSVLASTPPSDVAPEPATLALLALGGLAIWRRRKK
jgi:beta-glucanase (GH16 family)